ncbi:putative archaeal kinase (sugar kinase superfamily) [Archaeoglobus sulfaticallidus PM70-1]|uniref:Pantoate kinase n=1 Tax=Archaeoglobus sulfaticallidus PM70-1 TaxID=387631 RepID=N0BJN6_9EURY|nr:pantoate kinase [Archaeoglobus sulfaticallidus]AGK60360.1 putative archaeal kinase (sugar kinase superfamily) [Archaeoglobus sulfaticallidus PM70-1]
MTFFAPASITAFFSPKISDDPLKSGSTGVGITLSKGVKAELSDDRIRLNGRDFSFPTIELLFEKLGLELKQGLKLESQIPVGCGFGFSGAACLAAAFEINKKMKLKKGYFELTDIVHECEVESRTGLGDVVCQSYGGVVVRKVAGSPSMVKIEKYLFNDDLSFLVIGEIQTSKILRDDEIVQRINRYGEEALKAFLRNPEMENLFRISKEFAVKTGLMDDEVLEIIKDLERQGYLASMVMLGKVVFSNCDVEILKEYGEKTLKARISQVGVVEV